MIVSRLGKCGKSLRCTSKTICSSPACPRLQIGKGLRIGRRRRDIIFEITGDIDAGYAELRQAFGIRRGLGQTEFGFFHQSLRRARQAPPAPERPLRHARIHQNQGNFAAVNFAKKIGPDFGLGDEHEIGVPMVEETRHEARHVERNILMKGAGRQALRHDGSRSDGRCRKKNMKTARRKPLKQRQKREAFAHTHAMQPGERSGGTRLARNPEALLDALLVLQPLPLAPVEKERCEGCESGAGGPVNQKEKCAFHYRIA
jgi:hypothetical protein